MEDEQIVRLCRQGDLEPFKVIVDRYQSRLLSLAWGLLGTREEAEDATQEVFLQAYSHIGRLEAPYNIRGWLLAIGYRLCLDRLKKRKTERKYQPFLADKPEAAAAPADGAWDRPLDETSEVGAAWRKLRDKERTALTMAVLEDCPASEIAEVISCSVNTARVHLFNAKKKMRKWLEGKRHV